MNLALRALQLNIQGSKTAIFRGKEIEKELIDPQFAKIDGLAESVMKHAGKITIARRRRYETRARNLLPLFDGNEHFGKKESKRLRRLLTAMSLIKSPMAIALCLRAIERDPEHRLNEKVSKYLVSFPRRRSISAALHALVSSIRTQYYPSQQAQLLRVLRLNGCEAAKINRYARYVLTSSCHSYVKQEMLRTLCTVTMEQETLREVWKLFERGENADLKRSGLLCLICSNPRRPQTFLSSLEREIDPKILRTVRYLSSLSKEAAVIMRELTSMDQISDDRLMVEKLYKWPLFALNRDPQLRIEARKILVRWRRLAGRHHVKKVLKDFSVLFLS